MTTSTRSTLQTPSAPQVAIDELRRRLDSTRWPEVMDESVAAHGIAVATVRRLAEHWRTGFDWRAVEAELDRLGQMVLTTPDGRRLHAIHAKSPSATGVPLLLIHGWPDSLLRFTKLIPLLTAAGHDVVAPAIPGFGFSDQPSGEMSPALVAEDFAWLMGELGYTRYAAHGGDWGSAIATALTEAHPEAVVALHLTDVPWDKTFSVDREQASPAEQTFLDAAVAWAELQTYLLANTRNPDTIAMALSDSPVGLLAWIAEMYQEWSEDPIPDHDVLALVSLLWLTNSVRSSIRLYSEPAQAWDDVSGGDWPTPPTPVTPVTPVKAHGAPAGSRCRPASPYFRRISPAFREFAERFFTVERFTVMPRGGHFAALEQPELLAEDLIGFLLDR